MSNWAITTVIPTFRRPELLPIAVGSVLNQTWPDVVALVCDNNSEDNTPEVVARLAANDPRIQYHRHPTNIGPYANFAFGVSQARTPLFSILSDDDVLLPTFYASAVAALQKYPSAMFVAMHTLEINDAGWVLGGTGASKPLEERYLRAGEGFGRVPGIWTGYLFRRQIIEEIGFVRESAGPAADVGFVRHVAARYPGVIMPDTAALIRVHPQSDSGQGDLLRKANRAFWNGLAEPIENDAAVPGHIRAGVRQYIESMYVRGLRANVVSALADGNPDHARNTVRALRDLGHRRSAVFLKAFIALHQRVPLVPHALRALVRQRRLRREQQLADVNRQFELKRSTFIALLHGR